MKNEARIKDIHQIVRKTQSLAQLAAARIEGSQGVSTSHICSHHRTGMEGEAPKSLQRDIVSVGKTLKQLRFMEKRIITMRLASVVRQFVEENDDRSSPPWKFGEEELSSVLSI